MRREGCPEALQSFGAFPIERMKDTVAQHKSPRGAGVLGDLVHSEGRVVMALTVFQSRDQG